MPWYRPTSLANNIGILSSQGIPWHSLRTARYPSRAQHQHLCDLSQHLGIHKIARVCQVDGNLCVNASEHHFTPPADAHYTTNPTVGLSIYTADCLAVFLWSHQPLWLGAVHAGWRGLLKGVLASTCAFAPKNTLITAWIGPSICAGIGRASCRERV